MSMKERVSKLALKIAALLSSITVVVAVEPYIKLKGNFEVEFGRPEAVQSLHNSEQLLSAPAMLEIK